MEPGPELKSQRPRDRGAISLGVYTSKVVNSSKRQFRLFRYFYASQRDRERIYNDKFAKEMA